MRKAVYLMMVCAIMLPALATTCTYEFSGTITQVTNPNPFPGIALNQPFSGTFSYTLMPYNSTGIYDQTATLTFTTGSFSFAHNGTTQIIVVDYPISPTYSTKSDSFAFDASGSQANYSYFRTGVYLQDSTRMALSSTAIPDELSFSAFGIAQLRFTGKANGQNFNYIGAITHASAVPEPATLLMLLSAAPFLGRRKAR